jgi:hypothetical protein
MMDLNQHALQRAKVWAQEKEPAERCFCDEHRHVMQMYRCYGPRCRSHCHGMVLDGWLFWTWGLTDRYFCSRTCYLERLIKHLGEDSAARYIRRTWFRDNEVTKICDELEQLCEEQLDNLWELEELLHEFED